MPGRRRFHHFRRFGFNGGRRRESSRRRSQRIETEENSEEQNHIHHLSIASVRKSFRKNAISGRFHQGGIGDAFRLKRSQSSSLVSKQACQMEEERKSLGKRNGGFRSRGSSRFVGIQRSRAVGSSSRACGSFLAGDGIGIQFGGFRFPSRRRGCRRFRSALVDRENIRFRFPRHPLSVHVGQRKLQSVARFVVGRLSRPS